MLKDKPPYIIAEVGSNHLGNEKLCFQSIRMAKRAGADCVKFQIFDENNLVNKKLKIYKHVKDKKLKFQYQRFKKVKISVELVRKLFKFSKKNNIDFSVSPFDKEYIKKLKNYVDFFKVASGDINNFELLREISKTKKKTILSTGMTNQEEIGRALKFFDKKKVSILHCISSYPTNHIDANLININFLKKKYKVKTGYSDHVPGIQASINASLLGAEIIEKHFMPKTTKLAGDYSLSVNESTLKKMIDQIKMNHLMIGQYRSGTYGCEKYFKNTLRRSIYYSNNFKKGHKIKKTDIVALRPYKFHSLKVENFTKIIGTKLKKDVKKDQIVKAQDLWLKKKFLV